MRILAVVALLCCPLVEAAGPLRDLTWGEMMPAGPLAGSPAAPVASLDGETVRLPGFIVPLESDEGGLISEFLLVPYFGACIHLPPPPPNQIVYVTLEKPFDLVSMQQPYWIEGTMLVQGYSSEVAATVYTIRADRILKYDY